MEEKIKVYGFTVHKVVNGFVVNVQRECVESLASHYNDDSVFVFATWSGLKSFIEDGIYFA